MSSGINWEQVSMNIIVEAGSAKSSAMEAIFLAKDNKFEEAQEKMNEANVSIGEASHAHFEVIQKEASGVQLEFKVLFLHAEDQLLSTQTLILLAQEIIDLHKKMATYTGK